MIRLHPPRDAAHNVWGVLQDTASPVLLRTIRRLRHRPPYHGPLDMARDRCVLLFFEDCDPDTLWRGDRHLRRPVRRLWQAVRVGRRHSGFEMAFLGLVTALERIGYTVVVGDERLARANPTVPVGICGYPRILSDWDLPNPAVLGPGLFDHPSQAQTLMDDPRFLAYVVPSEWMRALFAPHWPGKVAVWPCGIDTVLWRDTSQEPKSVDLLVYDKATPKRRTYDRDLLQPILQVLHRKGLRVELVRCGSYDPSAYRIALGRARGFVFLSESETQGIAYQEALASGVPVLAWDQGRWLDKPEALGPEPVPASAVPYFDETCGTRFARVDEFEAALDRFLTDLPRYAPRRFVETHLSLEASAKAYLGLLQGRHDAGKIA